VPQPGRLSFGDFTFDPASGELARDGRRVRLQRQPSRLLELLIARRGEVVTRDEIRQALWGADTHVDFERSLNFCVAKLRAALRDDAASPRFVETIPTRGYRFVAACEPASRELEAESREPKAGSREPEAGSRQPEADGRQPAARSVPWSRAALATLAVALLIGIGYAIHAFRAQPRLPTIVVVPFRNETGDAGYDRVSKGVSDAAVARLAAPERIGLLLVIGNAEVKFSFKPAEMKATGESLGAQYLLLGQLKKDDRRFRLVAHLIRVSDQTHLWAKTFDSDTLDLPEQGTIAEAIASTVAGQFAKGSAAQTVGR
jgi:DNA-binding winged helix-turn-helix (wHTH) protein/TolB-like protein